MRVGGITITQPEWFDHAACRGQGPRKWFPVGHEQAGRRICDHCPVLTACLDHALADETLVGIWGGTNETQRDQLRQRKSA